jgi:hypothetical protein
MRNASFGAMGLQSLAQTLSGLGVRRWDLDQENRLPAAQFRRPRGVARGAGARGAGASIDVGLQGLQQGFVIVAWRVDPAADRVGDSPLIGICSQRRTGVFHSPE